jgi:putative transposase
MPSSAVMSARPAGNPGTPAPGSSIARRSRPRPRGRRGDDTLQNVNGRTRHLLVDTLGLLLAVVVTTAQVQERAAARTLLDTLRSMCSRLRLLRADQADGGGLLAWGWALRPGRNIRLDIVRRPTGSQGYLLLPKRWMVERTRGGYGRYPRRAKDYEYLTQTSATMLRVAMIALMIRRLARMTSCSTPSDSSRALAALPYV